MTVNEIREHVEEWLAAWNQHDLDAILRYYADDVVFRAPTVATRWGKPDGILRGKGSDGRVREAVLCYAQTQR